MGRRILVLAIVATAALASTRLLAPQSSGSSLNSWAPADSVLYVEGNVNVVGDQNAKLGALLAHFPGFGDGASLDARLTAAYDQIVGAATGTATTMAPRSSRGSPARSGSRSLAFRPRVTRRQFRASSWLPASRTARPRARGSTS